MRSRPALQLTVVSMLAIALAFAACGPGRPSPADPTDAGIDAAIDDAGSTDAGGDFDAGHVHPDAGPVDSGTPLVGPDKLSDTGLYADVATRTLSPGVTVFTPRYELWSDGAEKERYLLLPEDGGVIDTSDLDNWVFPVGTKVWKQFKVGGVLVETRLLWKQLPGPDGWFEMAYAWNADGTEAVAAPNGVVDALGTPHDIPSQQGCASCHVEVRDVLIGVSALQLAGDGGFLWDLADAGRLSNAPAAPIEVPGTGTVHDALAYLHANCGHCHREGNALAAKRTLRLNVQVSATQPELTGAYTTTIDRKTWHPFEGTTLIIVRGDPDASQLLRRTEIRDSDSVNESIGYQMPPTCTEVVDDAGVQLIRAWIQQL